MRVSRVYNSRISYVCSRVDSDRSGSHLADSDDIGKFCGTEPLVACNDFSLNHGDHGVSSSETEESDLEKCIE